MFIFIFISFLYSFFLFFLLAKEKKELLTSNRYPILRLGNKSRLWKYLSEIFSGWRKEKRVIFNSVMQIHPIGSFRRYIQAEVHMHTRTYVYDTYVCTKIRTTYIESVRFGRYNTHTQRYFLSFLLLSPTLIPSHLPHPNPVPFFSPYSTLCHPISFLPLQYSSFRNFSVSKEKKCMWESEKEGVREGGRG